MTATLPYNHVSREGFKLPFKDDTSYEADALSTKTPWPDGHFYVSDRTPNGMCLMAKVSDVFSLSHKV